MAAAATAELNINSRKHRSVYNENVMDWQQNPPCMRAIYERKSHDARNTSIKFVNDGIKAGENIRLEVQAGKENEMIYRPEETMLKNAETDMETTCIINDEPREVVQSSETLCDITAIQLKSPKQHKVVYNRTNHNHSAQKGQRKASQIPSDVIKKSQPEVVTPLDNEQRNETPAESSRTKSAKKTRVCTKKPPSPPLKLPKLHLVLTRNEILEDWVKITGQKYTGKPRKSTITNMGLGLCTSLTCPSTIRYLKGPWCK